MPIPSIATQACHLKATLANINNLYNRVSSSILHYINLVHQTRVIQVVLNRSFRPISLAHERLMSKSSDVAHIAHNTQHEQELYKRDIYPFLPP